jgi:seryl-tRNA(Sec) selenium transferase
VGLQGQVSELLDEVERLKVAVSSRDTKITAQMQEMDRLRSENRELRRNEERLAGTQGEDAQGYHG